MKAAAIQYAQSLYDSVDGLSEKEVRVVLKNFVLLLNRYRDLSKASEIMEYFQKIWNKQSGELYAELNSARQLDTGTRALIVQYLKDKTGAEKICLIEKTDKELIGGFVLRYDSKVLDGSLKNGLQSLRNKISN